MLLLMDGLIVVVDTQGCFTGLVTIGLLWTSPPLLLGVADVVRTRWSTLGCLTNVFAAIALG